MIPLYGMLAGIRTARGIGAVVWEALGSASVGAGPSVMFPFTGLAISRAPEQTSSAWCRRSSRRPVLITLTGIAVVVGAIGLWAGPRAGGRIRPDNPAGAHRGGCKRLTTLLFAVDSVRIQCWGAVTRWRSTRRDASTWPIEATIASRSSTRTGTTSTSAVTVRTGVLPRWSRPFARSCDRPNAKQCNDVHDSAGCEPPRRPFS